MNKWLLIMMLVIGSTAHAQNTWTAVSDKAEFKNKVQQSTNGLKTLMADFVQEKHLSFLEETVTSTGVFYFKKANQVRWEYKEPNAYFILINDKTITTVMNGKETTIDASKNKTFREINKIMLGSINGDIINHPDFESNLFESSEGYKLHLIPQVKALSNVISEIVVWFDKENMSVVQLKMIEASEDFSLIKFENKKLNVEVPDRMFAP
ncbi:outer membrane lipoprotein carrier protein LolA [bacterium SCSIO 12741]|nr:outer membrane lipoprotein carrier protein LolA [bacterium SCSIO 12741]